MSQDVASYLDAIEPEWQATVCRSLDRIIHEAIPGVTARLQYGKPHYLKDGKYTCVVGTAKGGVSFTIFNAATLDVPAGLFEPGPSDRKTITIKPGQTVDLALLTTLVEQATRAL